MSDSSKLIPVEQQTIKFHGDKIQAVRMADGTIYVPLRPICENIGVAWTGQLARIKDDVLLSQKMMSVKITFTDIDPTSKRPHTTEMIALPLQFMHGWLFGINAKRVKGSVRDSLLHYQEKCYTVLANAFSPDNSTIGRRIQLYGKQGRDHEWIQQRLLGMDVRDELESEWNARGIKTREEYGALTNEIYGGAFGLSYAEYMELKRLEAEHNLRDHMTTAELLVTAIGEFTTTEVARRDDAQGFEQNKNAAREGGETAKEAKEMMERRIGSPIRTSQNFLPKPDETQPKLLE